MLFMNKLFIFILFLLSVKSYAQDKKFDPPWNENSKGILSFTIKGVENVPDIYGDINDPQLVIFMGGNQFMVLDSLLAAFKRKYPQYERILVETLPPGLLYQQIKSGSLIIGNMRITVKPDIYTAGRDKIEDSKDIFERTQPFASTKLALMVQKNNPKQIKGLEDLMKRDIRISTPDKKIEGIGRNVEEAYIKAGGQELFNRIMIEKVKDSTTFVTQIHHRQSPMRILYNESDVAPVWETEIVYQKMLNHPVDKVDIPDKYNKVSVSVAGILKDALHKEAANRFVDFLAGEESKSIFKKYGFEEAH
jgi:molybdate transport system substrate-binding protein